MYGQPAWLAEAWREFGQAEIAGSRHNRRITALFKELGHEKHARDEVPWCAAFVGACLERAAHPSTRSLMARSYAHFGEACPKERIGAITVLSRGSDPALGHVGFLVGWSSEKLWLLGGNQSNAVSVAAFDRTRFVAMRWPPSQNEAGIQEMPEASDPTLFSRALKHVLEMEGGFTNDPYDPGGPTNKGITLKTLAAWRKLKIAASTSGPLLSALKKISDAEVGAIYDKRYWQPAGCESLPAPLALFHFDAAVNHGVTGAIRMLQEASKATVDGEIGPETLGRINLVPLNELLETYAAIRRKRYRALPHFWRFGRGWLNRVEKTLNRARNIPQTRAAGQAAASKSGIEMMKPTGDLDMANNEEKTSKWWGESMTIWGAIITAAAAILPTLGPIIGLEIDASVIRLLGEQVTTLVQALTALIGTALTVYGRSRAALPLMRRSITLKV